MLKLSGCNVDNCPAVWADEDGTLVVQGDETVTAAALGPVPAGETRVRIPREILLEAAGKLGAR